MGYYVHHHGLGHATRFRAVRDASAHWMVPISECVLADSYGQPGVHLPSDRPPSVTGRDDVAADGALHWAPLVSSSAGPRLSAFVTWLDTAQPSGVVVDVSVEAVLTCRLAGVRTVVVRQHGRRTDDAHTLGYRVADKLLAPWPRELEDPATPDWIVTKTEYVGFVCAARSGPATASPPAVAVVGADDVVVLWGSGGGTLADSALAAMADAVAGRIHLVGACFDAPGAGRWINDPRINPVGWVDDVAPLLANRPTVVASAGNNTVALAARSGARSWSSRNAVPSMSSTPTPAASTRWEPLWP